ncbi:RNA polymerase sigma factor [Imbroritus primus]
MQPHNAFEAASCQAIQTIATDVVDEQGAPPMTAGDREILFRNLLETHQNRLYRFIIRNIGNPSDAEDLTQQAFVEAVRSFQSFRGESELSTWLYGIAMNLVRNHLSRAPHRRFGFDDESALDGTASESPGPAEKLEQSQHVKHLEAVMAELPQSMRDVLVLVAVDELTYEEAAALLTIPVGTVRSRLSRARAALRSRLEERGVMLEF